jgi:signal transduction histidine kinase
MNFDPTQFTTEKRTVETLLDFLPYPFLVAEFRNKLYRNVYVNRKFTEEIGYACEEMPTIKDWFKLAYPDKNYRKHVVAEWTRRSDKSREGENNSVLMKVIIHTKYGKDYWYEVKSSIFENKQFVAFVNIHEEVLIGEELRRLSENRNRTLSILSHDIRVPLDNLLSLSRMVLNDHISKDEFTTIVKDVNDKAFKVLEFVDTTLQWTKSNFDKIEAKTETVLLSDVVDKVLGLYENQISRKNIKVKTKYSDQPFTGDSEILTIVIRNLISNAIKFSPVNTDIHITYKTSVGSKIISVADQGQGMTKAHIESIFSNEFVSTAGTQKEKGLGVGLKLCIQLLKRMGGNLEIKSEPGQGTEMKIIINS